MSLGQEDYMELMVTQLKNQNPLEPMENKEFISQMAQFSQVQGVNKIAQLVESSTPFNKLSSATSMLGQTIEYKGDDENTTESGTVEQVIRQDGKTKLDIGNDQIAIDRVVSVY